MLYTDLAKSGPDPVVVQGHGRQSIVKLINHEDGEPHFSDERSGVLSIQLV
jgi:hypothetical protein